MEQGTFLSAVEQYKDLIYRIALHYFGNAADADDAVQEVLLRLYTAEKPFEDQEHLRRWLIRVTVNVCKDILKSPWRKRRVPLGEVPDRPVFDEPEQGALYEAVMELPEKYRVVLDLFYYEELSVKEIGELLGVGVTTVTTRLSRARKLLAKRLKGVWKNAE